MPIPPSSTRNSLGAPIRAAMIQLLNQQLADTLDLGLQAKQAHWNVKGPNFIGLHALFDQIAEKLEELTDELAERAVALGGVALGTVQSVTESSRLPAYPVALSSGPSHLGALADAIAAVGATTRSAIDSAAQAGDADTADLFTEVSRALDKLLWMLEAHQPASA
ncbi:MAG: DNA starvation/stationary phase protection protein Dps [Verrucomicrobia bacterium]|nr:DNA starvation/stationary phase protection protein Dps [Verrucomicrobiota bacterium]